MRTTFVLGLGLAMCAAIPAVCQSLPAPPAGFEADAGAASMWARMRAAGAADGVMATKPNSDWPNCFSDPKIRFEYGWTSSPGADRSLALMAQTPEDPATTVAGAKDEPAGKQKYKNGLLWWRKVTQPAVGSSSSCAESGVVLYSGHWVGYLSGKMISISVANLYGSKGAGQAWIDEYIGRIVSAMQPMQAK